MWLLYIFIFAKPSIHKLGYLRMPRELLFSSFGTHIRIATLARIHRRTLLKRMHMKTLLAGLILLGAHAGAAAFDGQASLQWSQSGAAVVSAPRIESDYYTAMPELSAQSVLVFDQASGQPLLAKNASMQTPIASITKLMTAMLVLDAGLPIDESITLTDEDRDTLKGTGSRLAVGSSYTRGQLLHLALIASDNRAAHALGRTYPSPPACRATTVRPRWTSPSWPIMRIRTSRKSAISAPPGITPSTASAWWCRRNASSPRSITAAWRSTTPTG
jgi:hypothetical protein